MSVDEMRGVMSDEQLAQLFKENEAKRAEALALLGKKYACHPANQVRMQRSTPVLAAWAHA